MATIPEDIQRNLLSRLPVKSLVRFTSVSKDWLKLIRKDPHFRKMHDSRKNKKKASIIVAEYGLGRAAKIYSEYSSQVSELKSPVERSHEIIGCCNGILCLKHCVEDDALYLWNPATREHCALPAPLSKYNWRTYFGFGFHQGTNAYKLLKVDYACYPFKKYAWIYTVGSQCNTWKALGEYSSDIDCGGRGHNVSTLVNGTLYWLQSRNIGSFDLGDEVFRSIPKPKYRTPGHDIKIGELGGSLCLYCSYHVNNKIDIWMMKDDGVAKSWVLFARLWSTVIDNLFLMRPVGLWMSGEVIVCSLGTKLCRFNLQGEFTGEIESLLDGSWNTWQACSYIESLVSPGDIANVGDRLRKQKRKLE